jgi:hypothetical protein
MVGSVTDDIDLPTAQHLARAVTDLFETAQTRLSRDDRSGVVARVTEHVGCGLADMPNVMTTFASWEHVNLHFGVLRYLERHSPQAQWFGITGTMHGHQDLMDMLTSAERHGQYRLGPVDYATAAIGPDEAIDIIQFGLVPTRSASGHPVALAVRGRTEDSEPRCVLRVLAADRAIATEVRAEVEQLVRASNIFRGQLLSFDVSEHRGNELVSFLPRPDLAARGGRVAGRRAGHDRATRGAQRRPG